MWDGPRIVAARMVFKGFGTYNLMYVLSCTTSGMGAMLAAMLRPPRAPPVQPVVLAHWHLRAQEYVWPLRRKVVWFGLKSPSSAGEVCSASFLASVCRDTP